MDSRCALGNADVLAHVPTNKTIVFMDFVGLPARASAVFR
jgi:hypothetical protein